MASIKVINENKQRIDVLYKKHHKWLLSVAVNITADKDIAEELVGELYLYLLEKNNPALWYLDSFNLMYLRSFIKSRYINKLKVDNRMDTFSKKYETEDEEYDVEWDMKLENTYNQIVDELRDLERTKMWASSRLAQMYFFDTDMTLEKLANNIKISKSTAFLNVKKIKTHLKNNIENPFNK